MAAPLAAIFGLAGPRPTPAERALFAQADPWGFILFARNVENPAQLSALTRDLRACVGRDAPVLIDQEGGRVARLRGPHWRDWPDVATALAACPPEQAEAMLRLRYRLIADELHAAGVDVNCAPLLDVVAPGCHPFLRDRCLGSDAAAVARLGRAVRRGLEEGGVLPVVKHMPGHGRGDADSHRSLPVAAASRAALSAQDFAAFAAHADAALGMTAHVLFPALDPDDCATFSPAAIAAIRGEIGFDGLLMTDDIGMGALDGAVETRAARALAAGCDMVLHCSGDLAEMEALAAAVPRLSGRAAARADAALAARRAPEPFDPAEADAALADLALAHA